MSYLARFGGICATVLALALSQPAYSENQPNNSYTVKSGDNLGLISKRKHIPLSEIVQCNPGLKENDKIHPKQQIKLHDSYTVRTGDTLSEIASRYGSSLTEMLDYNQEVYKSRDELNVGQRLAVPCRSKLKTKPVKGRSDREDQGNHSTPYKSGSKQVAFSQGLKLPVVSDSQFGNLFKDSTNSGVPLLKVTPADLSKHVSEHFVLGEFAQAPDRRCLAPYQGHVIKKGGDVFFDHIRLDPNLVRKLELLRTSYGSSLPIDEGYRPPVYHACTAHGEAPKSRHVSGRAVDIPVADKKLRKEANRIFNPGGMGTGPTTTHVDVRNRKTRWHY